LTLLFFCAIFFALTTEKLNGTDHGKAVKIRHSPCCGKKRRTARNPFAKKFAEKERG